MPPVDPTKAPSTAPMAAEDIVVGTGMHSRLAKIQYKLGIASKEAATEKMEAMRAEQQEQKNAADLIQRLRNSKKGAADSVFMDKDLLKEVASYDIKVTPTDKKYIERADAIKKMNEELERIEANKTTNKNGEAVYDLEDKKLYECLLKAFDRSYSGTLKNDVNSDFPMSKVTGLTGHKLTQEQFNALKQGCAKAQQKLDAEFKHSAGDIDTMIQSLQASLDRMGSNSQQTMVQINDLQGQFNSFTSGSSTIFQKGNNLLDDILKSR